MFKIRQFMARPCRADSQRHVFNTTKFLHNDIQTCSTVQTRDQFNTSNFSLTSLMVCHSFMCFPAFDVVYFPRLPYGSSYTDSHHTQKFHKHLPHRVTASGKLAPGLRGGTRRPFVSWHRFSSGISCACSSGFFNTVEATSSSFSFASAAAIVSEVLFTACRSARSFADLLFLKFTAVVALAHVVDSEHGIANTVNFHFLIWKGCLVLSHQFSTFFSSAKQHRQSHEGEYPPCFEQKTRQFQNHLIVRSMDVRR